MSGGVLLVGASGLAREVLAAGAPDVVGLLDDDPRLQGEQVGGMPVLGDVASAVNRDEDLLVCVGPSLGRRAVVTRLIDAGTDPSRFRTFVAPGARIGATCTVAYGVIVLEGVVVTADARIGEHVVVMPGCVITHDDILDPFATLAAGVTLGGGVMVGEAAYVGMNASVHPGRRVGEDAIVGMGAVVLTDVPAGETWAGVPAVRIGAST